MALTATRIREQKRLLFLRVVRGARWFGATRLLSCSTERREKLVAEIYVDRVHTEHAVLDIGEDIGALVIYTRQEMLGKEIEVSPKGNHAQKTHTAVLERRVNGRTMFAALFLALPEGDYITLSTPSSEITIFGGQVAELDWRESNVIIHPRTPYGGHPDGHDK
jgi:hypothetical protein